MRNLVCMLMVVVTGCKDVPPPITNGKCVATRYSGERATNQVCIHKGFNYVCAVDISGTDTCNLTGEATGEMPK